MNESFTVRIEARYRCDRCNGSGTIEPQNKRLFDAQLNMLCPACCGAGYHVRIAEFGASARAYIEELLK